MNFDVSNSNKYDKLKCIWMASDIVRYKLCDKGFNCQGCLFDKAMRNILTESDFIESALSHQDSDYNLLDEKIKNLEKITFNGSLFYLKSGFVLNRIGDNTYFLGFNSVIMQLLDGEMKASIGEDYKMLCEGDDFFELTGGWGSVLVKAPFDLFYIDRLTLFNKFPEHNYWFAIVGVTQGEIVKNTMPVSLLEEQKENVVTVLKNLREKYNLIGKSMYDGGEKINRLYQIIGTDDYLSILNNFFSIKTKGN